MDMFYYSHITPESMHYCINDFVTCSMLVMSGITSEKRSDVVKWFQLMRQLSLREDPTYLASGFVYVARDLGLIPQGAHQSTCRIEDIKNAAKRACEISKLASPTTGRPRCFDAVYIYHLLRHIFRFQLNDKVTFIAASKDGTPATWSLGAAVDRITSQ